MGWFWADSPSAKAPPPPHPMPPSNAKPPPGCPMHEGSKSSPFPSSQTPSSRESSCPIKSPNIPPPPALEKSVKPPSTISKLNPLNYMFGDLSQSRAPNQTVSLPVSRETSSIPRGDTEGNWEYPSPQQMYNAMLRKGYTDTPQDAVESMVAVHNFLNEGAWAEIVGWERRFSRGLRRGWEMCRIGEENAEAETAKESNDAVNQPRLVRFMGRPKDITPKAAVLQALGYVYPEKYGCEPPFDRHDWFVQRQSPSGPREVRYVIDYYSGPPEPTGEPVFYLDVRPAIDRPSAAIERMMRWGGDVWWKASGGVARDP